MVRRGNIFYRDSVETRIKSIEACIKTLEICKKSLELDLFSGSKSDANPASLASPEGWQAALNQEQLLNKLEELEDYKKYLEANLGIIN